MNDFPIKSYKYFIEFNEFKRPGYDHLICFVFTEFVNRQRKQLEALETACVKTQTDHGPWTEMREHCEISDEDDRWLTYADKAISMIDRDDIW